MMNRPEPVAVTVKEGGYWLPWQDFCFNPPARNPNAVHAIKFDDGSIFDTVNGWRGVKAQTISASHWGMFPVT